LEEKTIELVEKYNLLKAYPLFLLPVRITTRKNIETGLHTLFHLRDSFPDAQMVVTGPPGPHNPQNQAYFRSLLELRDGLNLQSAVHFLAENTLEILPDEVISDLYRIADALFLPSLEEGFGIPILEAGVSRLPIFCSDIPSLRSLGGEFVSYFPPNGGPEQIADLVRSFFRSNPRLQFPSRVRSNYTWEGVYQGKIAPLLQAVKLDLD
jgi:mannosylglucosylglycerate synthase